MAVTFYEMDKTSQALLPYHYIELLLRLMFLEILSSIRGVRKTNPGNVTNPLSFSP
jgi:hypothetical protein